MRASLNVSFPEGEIQIDSAANPPAARVLKRNDTSSRSRQASASWRGLAPLEIAIAP
jgi:hypothetical protein